MKKLSQMGRLDMDTIFAIMTEEKANQRETVKIKHKQAEKILSEEHNAEADGGNHHQTFGA